MHDHPFVSEAHEGKPWFEWCVAIIVVISISVTAIVSGLVRLILREKSPWKVRSVAFDSIIGICLGVGLLVTYFSF